MFGIGFFELLVIAVLGLLVFGPEKLPEAIRTLVITLTKAKRSWANARKELEEELGMDDIRREIHNAQVMADMEKIKSMRISTDAQEEESNRLRDSSDPTKDESQVKETTSTEPDWDSEFTPNQDESYIGSDLSDSEINSSNIDNSDSKDLDMDSPAKQNGEEQKDHKHHV